MSSYLDEIEKYKAGMASRLNHAQDVSAASSQGLMNTVKEKYDEITSSLGQAAGSAAAMGVAITATKKVRAARAKRLKAKQGQENPNQEPTDDAPQEVGNAGVETEEGDTLGQVAPEDVQTEDPRAGDVDPSDVVSDDVGQPSSAPSEGSGSAAPEAGSEGGGAGPEASSASRTPGGQANDTPMSEQESADLFPEGTAPEDLAKGGSSVLGDVGEAVGDFIDPAALVVSGVVGIVDLFETLFGDKDPSQASKTQALASAPSQIVGQGVDPSALSRANA